MTPGRVRLIDRIPIPEFMQRDSELARWLQLVWFGSGTMIGIGLLVTGIGLMALGLVIALNGFGVVEISAPDELGTSLALGLVVAVAGSAALGLGLETQVGHGYVRRESAPWEIAIAHLPGLVVFVWGLAAVRSLLDRLIEDAPEAASLALRYVDAVRDAWPIAALVGIPVLWVVHQFMVPHESRMADYAPAVVFIAWAVGAVSAFG
jgi:hypothetical protein